MNIYSKKSKKIFATIIAIVLILAMIAPLLLSSVY